MIPVAWSLGTVVVAVALGEPTAGLFDAVFPAVLIIPLVVLLPAVTEELAWRGFALPRLLTAMSPLAAALVLAIPWTPDPRRPVPAGPVVRGPRALAAGREHLRRTRSC